MSVAMNRRLGLVPWALLGVGIVAAFTVFRSPAPALPQTDPPGTADAPAHGSARPLTSASSGRTEAPLSEDERRDVHIRIPHEECEEGVKRINELAGRDPTDPKGVRLVGVCLAYGNVAWYKCVLRASNLDQAGACDRRLLVPPQ
jgi:hypothetical protein